MERAKATGRDGINAAVAQNLGIPVSHANRAVEAVLDVVSRELLAGRRVSLSGFGTFEVMPFPEGSRRNPRTGEMVPRRNTVRLRFRTGLRLMDMLNGRREVPVDRPIMRRIYTVPRGGAK